jgi:putative hydroxymethylpyrimidine transporter CytX
MTVAAERPASNEAPYTLDEPAPKVLSFADQSAFWANLGVSLLAFSGAYTVLAPDANGKPQLSLLAGIVAMITGTAIGGIMIGLAAVPGARTGAPAMVLLRGLFGGRLSYLPTVLNIVQLIGWATFELITIAGAAKALFGGSGPQWPYIVAAGLITTVLTIWPLGSVRILRRYVTVAMIIALGYFYVQFLRRPLPNLNHGSWSHFWEGADFALAVSISWVPMAADYTRHARSEKAAFGAASAAYGVTQIVAYILGIFALAQVGGDANRAFDPFLHVAAGAVFFAVLVLREVDQSFADVYSTGISIQNLAPKVDRRILTIGLGVLTTVLGLVLNIDNYQDFLTLIGSVFVPMLGVLAVDFFWFGGRRGWDVSTTAPARWGMLPGWAIGIAVYQLINPGNVGWWSRFWVNAQGWLHFTPQSWMSASLFSFMVAGLATVVAGVLAGRKSAT